MLGGAILVVAGLAAGGVGVLSRAHAPEPLDYSALLAQVRSGDLSQAVLNDAAQTVEATAQSGARTVTQFPAGAGTALADRMSRAGVVVTVEPPSRSSLLTTMLVTLLPVVVIIGFLIVAARSGMLGGGGLGGLRLGKRAEAVDVPKARFTDIAGIDEAVTDLREVVDFLHDPDRFTRTGATVPRGFLLVGPPGTGKTLLARAVAGEAGVPFFAISGSDFVQVFAGQGAARVRELFARARASADGRAIVFIDEIDAVGKARGRGLASGANDERESTLNQLLVEMDGFSRAAGIVVIAATNRADVLDPALLRPGRFDRRITVPVPDRAGRERILRLYSASRPFEEAIDWSGIARRIPGMSGADIEQMLNEAALVAARDAVATISGEHVEAALATSMLGRERRSAVVSPRDRSITAWHEAGHAVAALVLEHADDPVQVTIVPRGSAGGVTWLSGSEHDLITRQQAAARLVVALAGRAAEEVHLDGDHTQGAHGDLEFATALARQMVTRYGMGDRLVSLSEEDLLASDGSVVNAEVDRLLTEALVHARALMAEHARVLEAVVAELLERETLTRDDLDDLSGR